MKEYSEMPEPRCRSQLQQPVRLVFMGIYEYIFCLVTVVLRLLFDFSVMFEIRGEKK